MTRRVRSGGGGQGPDGQRSDPTLDPMDRLRQSIDAIDKEMVRLLNERAGCAIALGRIKKDRGLPIYQPAREEEVLGNVQRENVGPLESEALRRLFERIIDESRRIERIATERALGRGSDPADSGESQD
jgi:chorismate mutase